LIVIKFSETHIKNITKILMIPIYAYFSLASVVIVLLVILWFFAI